MLIALNELTERCRAFMSSMPGHPGGDNPPPDDGSGDDEDDESGGKRR